MNLEKSVKWAHRSRQLDRYRWHLLRERHSRLSSALRFFRDALGDLLFGVCAHWRLATTIESTPCDFLLLQASPKVIPLKRKKLLIEALHERGRLVETALEARGVVLRSGLLRRPPQRLPLRYFGYGAYAAWIVEKYSPKILLNDRNGSLYAPFLRLMLNAQGGALVQLAHATTVERSRRLGMNDYDYYFLFGKSSLYALQSRALRFGSSKAVLSGSHMIDAGYDLPVSRPDVRTLLILGVGPDKEKETGYRLTYKLLRDWAAKHPDYRVLIKRHPRSKISFWMDAEEQLQNVQVLPAQCSLVDALMQASVVVNIMSNAVIEAALAGRPVVPVCLSKDPDIFSQAQFFGERVTNLDILQARLDDIGNSYAQQIKKSREFADFHLANGVCGLDKTLQALDALLHQKDLSKIDVHTEALPGMP